MGIDTARFQGDVDEELVCPICSSVLEDPIQAPVCEHAFCRACIYEWLSHQQVCPIDRQAISGSQLKPVPRILRNMLSRLSIRCDNEHFGCPAVVSVDSLPAHLAQCAHNPKRPVCCQLGCGLVVPLDKLEEHNCVRSLRTLVEQQTALLERVQQELTESRYQISQLARELHTVKEFLQTLRQSDPRVSERLQLDEVLRWAHTLPRARITRWGGMVSTPDALLKIVIQRCLSDSGAPPRIVEGLMDHSHERGWPTGLYTLETRQSNRRHFESYVCRRVPGKQAVVVLACENTHMHEELILQPGLVLIFAHGVETDTSSATAAGPVVTSAPALASLSSAGGSLGGGVGGGGGLLQLSIAPPLPPPPSTAATAAAAAGVPSTPPLSLMASTTTAAAAAAAAGAATGGGGGGGGVGLGDIATTFNNSATPPPPPLAAAAATTAAAAIGGGGGGGGVLRGVGVGDDDDVIQPV